MNLPGAVTFQPASRLAAEALVHQGIDLPGKPSGSFPEIPLDITELTDQVLMFMFEEFRRWCDFLDLQVSAARVDESVALSKALAEASGKSVAVTKARAELEPGYQAAMSYRALVESQAKRAERGYYHCSRELSRRTQPRRPEKPREYGWGENGKGHLAG